MFVFDSSAYLNGWHDHYRPQTFPSVWKLVSDAMADGRVISPRAVYNELTKTDDDVATWARARVSAFVEAGEEVQREAGQILALLPNPGVRDGADPWVVAEGKVRGLTVVTYEGRSFSGVPTKRWHKSMPGICAQTGVPCLTLGEALASLGGSF